MDTLILGLLMFRNLTVYEIQNFLREGMYLMYSDSKGSIQSAMGKLIKTSYVMFSEYVENGKNKKVYSITDDGKTYFLNWLSQPLTNNIHNREIVKLFFLGLLPAEKRESIIMSYIAALNKKLSILHSTQEKARKTKVKSHLKDISSFQLATIRLSVESIQFELEWYSSLLETIKNGGDIQ